ncbi:MAG: glycosyltransferase family 4 protein [Acidobacteria bacterium]|nr:glycosyltransferase family 4 protein [Acidobacteriota bacterium]
MLRVAAYTQGLLVPSARFRVRQYTPVLREMGVEMREYCPWFSSYPPRLGWLRPFWSAGALGERLVDALRSHSAEITLLQREMLSTLVTAEPLTRRPRVLDVDDAIFLNRNERFVERWAQLFELVICGNRFLADHYCRWNPNVAVLPTAVDTDRFLPSSKPTGDTPLIGWSGSSSGFVYLEALAAALAPVLERHPRARLRVIADRRPVLAGLPGERLDYVRWSPDCEASALADLSVGLMPLDDTPWARGKCSFKLLTYMSCGIPVVASPVGMNPEVLAHGGGVMARHRDEWVDAIGFYLTQRNAARQTGRRGREVVVQHYSLRVLAPKLAGLLLGCAHQAAGAGRTAAAERLS